MELQLPRYSYTALYFNLVFNALNSTRHFLTRAYYMLQPRHSVALQFPIGVGRFHKRGPRNVPHCEVRHKIAHLPHRRLPVTEVRLL